MGVSMKRARTEAQVSSASSPEARGTTTRVRPGERHINATLQGWSECVSHLIGIDVGTGGTRAIVIDATGRIVGSATDEHEPFASPQTGWAEQDPHDWWRATCGAVRAALAKAGIAGEAVTAIGFSGQMHGSVLLDQHDEVIRPALIWGAHRENRRCPPDRAHAQPGAHRVHAAQAALGARARAGRLDARPRGAAAEGLRAVPAHG
jgi:hypothetical protein